MAISFNETPSTLRAPLLSAEFDASQAQQGPALLAYSGIILAQKTSDGTAEANSLHRVVSETQAAVLGGRGSLAHRMAIAWFARNKSTALWILFLEDAEGGTEATATVTFSDTDPSAPGADAGVIPFRFGAVSVPVALAEGDDQDDAATALAAAITAKPDLPVTAEATDNAVTVTFRHKGEAGNDYDIRVGYQPNESGPAGIDVAITAMSGGATNPTLTAGLAALADMWFHVWAHPFKDDTSLDAIDAKLDERAGPLKMIDGVAFGGARGSYGTLSTLGNSRNGKYASTWTQPAPNPLTPPWEFAAEVAAAHAYYGQIDPARPFHTIELVHTLPPPEPDLFTYEERNGLLYEGVATTRVVAGKVQIEGSITNYQVNAAGGDDDSFLQINTPLTLMYLRYSWRTRLQAKYPRHKLASDGVRLAPGQAVMTPKLGKAEALAWFRQMESLGLVEGFDQFKRDLVVERNALNPNRLDWLLPPDLINQLIVGATKFAFRL